MSSDDPRKFPTLPFIPSPEQERAWFKVGDIITCKGYQFRVKSVKPDELRLKLIRVVPK